MFGHDDNNHDENDKPGEDHQDDSWQHPGPPPADDELSNETGTPNDSADSTDSTDSDADDNKDDNKASPAGFSISQGAKDHDDTPDDAPGFNPNPADDSGTSGTSNDLIDLKQEALTKLSPLVGHLDQTPDEKFRTLMMMIQASDDQRLVRQAYETALKIDDEKERAQALLDIVNEINYFTHNPES